MFVFCAIVRVLNSYTTEGFVSSSNFNSFYPHFTVKRGAKVRYLF